MFVLRGSNQEKPGTNEQKNQNALKESLKAKNYHFLDEYLVLSKREVLERALKQYLKLPKPGGSTELCLAGFFICIALIFVGTAVNIATKTILGVPIIALGFFVLLWFIEAGSLIEEDEFKKDLLWHTIVEEGVKAKNEKN